MSLRKLEFETGCKVKIRGKGSMRDKLEVLNYAMSYMNKEDRLRTIPGNEHLNEPLHDISNFTFCLLSSYY